MDLWIDTRISLWECMEVLVDDQWYRQRMEMNLAREWYLVGTPYCGDLGIYRARIQIKSGRKIAESETDKLVVRKKK